MDKLKVIKSFLKGINKTIVNRGKRIHDNTILEINATNDTQYNILVPSESSDEEYSVTIDFILEYEDINAFCPCYYFDEYGDCKHVVASILTLQESFKKSTVAALKVSLPLISPEHFEANHITPGYFIIPSVVITRQLIENISTVDIYYLERKIWKNYLWRPKIHQEQKQVSMKYDARISCTISYIDSHTLNATCNCLKINTAKLCEHATILLLVIKSNLSGSHFRQYDDLSEEKNTLLAPYGLTLNDKLADSFTFDFDYDGHLRILKTPENIIIPSQAEKWQHMKDKLSLISLSDFSTEKTTLELYDKIALQIELNPTNEPHLILSVLGIRKKKTGEGLVYKKLGIRNKSSLPLLELYFPEVVPILQPISLDLWDQFVNHKNTQWDYIPSKQKANWILRLKNVFDQLATCKQCPEILLAQPDKTYKVMTLQTFVPIISFKLSLDNNYISLQGLIKLANNVTVPIYETNYMPWFILLYQSDLYKVEDTMAEVLKLFSKSDLYIPFNEFNQLQNEVINPLSKKYEIIYDDTFKIDDTKELEVPTMQIKLSELGNDYLILNPSWKYGDMNIDFYQGSIMKMQDQFIAIRRNETVESEYLDWLKSQHPSFANNKQSYFYLPITEAVKDLWYFKFLENAREKDVELFGFEKLKHFNYNTSTPTITVKAGNGIDWFDVEIEVDYGGLVVPLAELKKAIVAQQQFIQLSDGSLGAIPEEWITKYSYLLKSAKLKDDVLQVSKFQWTLVDALHDQLSDEKIAQELKRKKELLGNLDTVNTYAVPKKIKAKLRDYQKAGFQWLCTLDSLEWGACLADDMGLGKTLQTLAFLVHIQSIKKRTHLIICPTSLIYNWESEILKFCKHLKYHIHYGIDRADSITHFADYDIIITSYGMLRSDIKEMAAFKFHYVILDESHAIKNPASQVAKAVSVLHCKNRIALSGTPLQNNTMDIYSQMNFLNPGMLGSMESFKSEFATPIDKHGDKAKIDMLRTLLYPFMLRRTKTQVAKDLPDKTESIIWCEMDTPQRKIYNSFKEYYRKLILNKIDEEGMNKSSFYILEGLLKLRQICDSPAILNEEEVYPNESIKIEELVRELEENTSSHKALVFSQFVTMLKLVEKELIKKEIDYIYLDGQTKAAERKKIVETYQSNSDKKVMLISLKAGGVGLNLTAADYVYLIDPWWNPAIEQQAIDRTHRIGQTQKVFAYKMICKDSIEEKILMLQDKKKSLSTDIISGETSFVKKLTRDDIQFLFT